MKRFYFLLIILLVILAALAIACQPVTPTPTESPPATPTPLSPLPSPMPPVSPLQVLEAEASSGNEFWVEHGQDVPVYTTGDMPTLFFAAKLVVSDTVVYSETVDTGLAAPTVTDTAGTKFDGSVFFDYPLLEVDASEWANCWWASDGEMYVLDDAGQFRLVAVRVADIVGHEKYVATTIAQLRQIDRAECVYEGDTQDSEGYHFIGTVQGLGHKYFCPISLVHEVPTGITPTPTPTPGAGTGGDGAPSVITAIVISGIVVVAIIVFIWLFAREIVRGWISEFLRR